MLLSELNTGRTDSPWRLLGPRVLVCWLQGDLLFPEPGQGPESVGGGLGIIECLLFSQLHARPEDAGAAIIIQGSTYKRVVATH